MSNCPNCGEEYSLSRAIEFEDCAGTEHYCKNCPPEKWSMIEVSPTSFRAKRTWDEIFKAVKEGALE